MLLGDVVLDDLRSVSGDFEGNGSVVLADDLFGLGGELGQVFLGERLSGLDLLSDLGLDAFDWGLVE